MTKPLLVVYADDDEMFRSVIAQLRREHGIDVHVCGTGDDAVTLSASVRPDVVLLDLDMPGWDGFETARKLRQTAETAALRIVAITGTGSGWRIKLNALEAGFDEFLVKPLPTDTLLAALYTGR
jgi:DNA-binding response OmpR family regulator